MRVSQQLQLPQLVVVYHVVSLTTSLVSVGAIAYDRTDYQVHGLEDVVDAFGAFDGDMYAGLLPTSTDPDEAEDSKFMFWLFQSEQATHSDTITIWFNGGPGCSSFQGALFENAPVTTPHHPAGFFQSYADEPLGVNDWAWTRATNMMYLEMPQGTGFSFGPTPDDEFDIAGDVYGFLQNFYDTFPEFRSKHLYLFGESYAGYYVPSIAHGIHQRNLRLHHKDRKSKEIRLAGIGLGNGWIEAKTQGPAVIDFAFWHGMIDEPTKDSLYKVWEACDRGDPLPPPFHQYTIPDECSIMGAVMAAAGSEAFPASTFRAPNPYDVTTFDLYPMLFDDNSTYFNFYNNPKVKKALHAPPDHTWLGCMAGAGRRRRHLTKQTPHHSHPARYLQNLPGELLLAHDEPETMAPYLAELLDADIRVLIYNADRDLTTCAQGSERVLNGLVWKGSEQWLGADRALWMVDEAVAGYSKELDGLTFLVVYNAGHLMPNNLPIQALDLVQRFLGKQSFQDVALPSFILPDVSESTKASSPLEGLERESMVPSSKHSSGLQFAVMVALLVAAYGLGYYSAVRSSSRGYVPVP